MPAGCGCSSASGRAGSGTKPPSIRACGELLIGIALIVGALTGIAAFFGGFMNWNFMMAGSASANPLLERKR